jgi:pyruvate,water dikinase
VFPAFSDLSFDTYVNFVLRNATRRAWGGAIERRDRITHPLSGAPGIYIYYAYQEREPDENLTVAQIVELDRRLKACAPLTASSLVFVPSILEQENHIRPLVPELNAAGVAVRFPADLVEREYEAYSVGESYGYLHVVPAGTAVPEDYGSRDVLVLEAAPPDLTTLAGMISTLPQSSLSHSNLRLRERGLPNVMLTSAYTDSRVQALEDQLVHVVATETELTLESATLAEAQAYWDAHTPMVGPVTSDLTVTALEGMDTLTHEDAIAYGAKAANLGELHAILPAANRVEGFGIPFSAYRDFIEHNNIDADITALLADPQVDTDRGYRDDALDDLRDAIRDGALQPGFFAALEARLREVYGNGVETQFIRFRSSTNAEDLDEFSGAGLYDSKTGCLGDDLDGDATGPSRCLSTAHREWIEAELVRRRAEQTAHPERWWLAAIIADLEDDLVEEKPIAEALVKVWRSLWNLRAYDEREYYGIPHTDVYMGIAVQPTFVLERQESVAITNLTPDAGDPVYRVVSQLGEVGIVRPIDPGAVPETLTFRRSGNSATSVQVVVPSSLSPGAARSTARRDHHAGHAALHRARPLRRERVPRHHGPAPRHRDRGDVGRPHRDQAGAPVPGHGAVASVRHGIVASEEPPGYGPLLEVRSRPRSREQRGQRADGRALDHRGGISIGNVKEDLVSQRHRKSKVTLHVVRDAPRELEGRVLNGVVPRGHELVVVDLRDLHPKADAPRPVALDRYGQEAANEEPLAVENREVSSGVPTRLLVCAEREDDVWSLKTLLERHAGVAAPHAMKEPTKRAILEERLVQHLEGRRLPRVPTRLLSRELVTNDVSGTPRRLCGVAKHHLVRIGRRTNAAIERGTLRSDAAFTPFA